MIPSTSRNLNSGPASVGSPAGIFPVTGTPSSGSPKSVAAAIESVTTPSATGFPGSHRSPNAMRPMAMTPTRRTRYCDWPSWPTSRKTRSKNSCPPPFTPSRLGICVIAMVRPAPALKPTRMLSLINFTSTLRRNSHANRLSAGHREGRETGNLGVALPVPLCHCPHGSGHHQRDGGSRPDRKLARGSKQGITHSAQQIAVNPDLRRQTRKPRIGQGNRNCVGRKGYPGDDIAGQPGQPVFSEPTRWRKPPEPDDFLPVVRQIRHRVPTQSPSTALILNIGPQTGTLDAYQRIRAFSTRRYFFIGLCQQASEALARI